jgi:putative NADH-flavin reductase
MNTIAVIGFTGYGGRHITAEALERKHNVIGVSRHPSGDIDSRIDVRPGTIEDRAFMNALFAEADVVVVAVHATADGQPFLIRTVPNLLALASEHGKRLGFIGGSGSLLVAEGGPRLLDSPDFSFKNRVDSAAMADILDALRAAQTNADWFYVSPAYIYGAHAPGERHGTYRVDADVILKNAAGKSEISGPDFASAVLDEIEAPRHRRTRFTVGY